MLRRRETPDLRAGDWVTPTPKQNDKAEGRETAKPKKPPGFRKFQKLLKKVVNAPPLKTDMK